MAEHDFFAVVVQLRQKRKPPPMRGLAIVQPGERAGDLGDVLLRVAAIDAERVQLEQLATVIFVQTFWRLGPLLLRRHLATGARCRRKSATAWTARHAVSAESSLTGDRMRSIGVRAHPVIKVEEHC